jgi:hypothetical protein
MAAILGIRSAFICAIRPIGSSRHESGMPLFEMAFGDFDSGPVITRDAEIAVQRFQKLNLGGRNNVLSTAMRLKIDALAIGA